MNMQNEETLAAVMTRKEAAAAIRGSVAKVDRMIHAGQLSSIKVGRSTLIYRSSVARILNPQK